jgi:hypothetical protein
MSDEDFDEFVQGATLVVHDLWTKAGGGEMKANELQGLNTVLDYFFDDKRSAQ